MISLFHRGDTVYYPENSIEAVISAVRMGADIIEIDLCLTKDGVLVLLHDANDLSQTTDWSAKQGRDGLPTSKVVSDWTLAELRELRLKKGSTVTEYVIPTFKEVLRVTNGRAKLMLDKTDIWSWNNDVYPVIVETEAWETCILPRQYNLATQTSILEQMKENSGQNNLQVYAFIGFNGTSNAINWDSMRNAGLTPIAYWEKECVTPAILEAAIQLPAIKGTVRIFGQNHAGASGSSETEERWELLYNSGVNIVMTDRGIDLQKYIADKFY